MLYEMIAGEAPFNGGNPGEISSAILQATPSLLHNDKAELPVELRTIIEKTLRKQSTERYRSAGELIEALKSARRQMELRPTLPSRRRRLVALALALLGLGGALALVFSWSRISPTHPPPPEKSIAVLPFENLSDDRENAFFAAGVQEEILSNLARIADLKVISRTSTLIYEFGKPRDSRQIGRELGVAHLLEGSVQRTGDRLRIHARLTDTETNFQRWTQTYDRTVADVFSLQSEIAQTIAAQLQTEISDREKTAIARPPTTDLVANHLYTQAIALSVEPSQPVLYRAIELLEQALARDPNFYLAYCALARIHLGISTMGYDHTPARLAKAEAAIARAAQLQPEGGEAHLARAEYLARARDDYDRARAELELARRALPNSPAVYSQTAYIDRRQGRWSEAIRNMERAVELDPRNAAALFEAASTYSMIGRHAEAAALGRRAATLAPRDYFTRLFAPWQIVAERADLGPLRRELDAILAEDPAAVGKIGADLLRCALLERDVAAADRALALMPRDGFSIRPSLVAPHEFWAGQVARLAHRPEAARAAFEAAGAKFKKVAREEPGNASAWSMLGYVEAVLGRKEEAIEAGRHACSLLPLAREPTSGLRPLRDLARIYALAGENDLALEVMTSVAEPSMGFDYGNLKLDPVWDSIRGDPRFEKIVAALAPRP